MHREGDRSARLAQRSAATDVTCGKPTRQPDALYARDMGERFSMLAPSVAAHHGVLTDGGATGRAFVTRGRHPLACLVALLRLPTTGEHPLHVAWRDVPTQVSAT